jgi:hypothetical protein
MSEKQALSLSDRLAELATEVRGMEIQIWGEWGTSSDPGFETTLVGDEILAMSGALERSDAGHWIWHFEGAR